MFLLCVMGLIEYEQIDVLDPDMRVQETLVKNICRTHYHHTFPEILEPYLFAPEVKPHSAKQMCYFLVDIISKHRSLLVHKGDTIHLNKRDFSSESYSSAGQRRVFIPRRKISEAVCLGHDQSIRSG